MHPSKSKPTNSWAALLKESLQRRGTQFPEDAVSAKEIATLLKNSGLPSGRVYVQQWVAEQIKAGKVKAITGQAPGKNDRLRRTVKYVIAK